MASYATVPAADLGLPEMAELCGTLRLVDPGCLRCQVQGVGRCVENFPRRWRGARYLISTQVGRLRRHHGLRSKLAGF